MNKFAQQQDMDRFIAQQEEVCIKCKGEIMQGEYCYSDGKKLICETCFSFINNEAEEDEFDL